MSFKDSKNLPSSTSIPNIPDADITQITTRLGRYNIGSLSGSSISPTNQSISLPMSGSNQNNGISNKSNMVNNSTNINLTTLDNLEKQAIDNISNINNINVNIQELSNQLSYEGLNFNEAATQSYINSLYQQLQDPNLQKLPQRLLEVAQVAKAQQAQLQAAQAAAQAHAQAQAQAQMKAKAQAEAQAQILQQMQVMQANAEAEANASSSSSSSSTTNTTTGNSNLMTNNLTAYALQQLFRQLNFPTSDLNELSPAQIQQLDAQIKSSLPFLQQLAEQQAGSTSSTNCSTSAQVSQEKLVTSGSFSIKADMTVYSNMAHQDDHNAMQTGQLNLPHPASGQNIRRGNNTPSEASTGNSQFSSASPKRKFKTARRREPQQLAEILSHASLKVQNEDRIRRMVAQERGHVNGGLAYIPSLSGITRTHLKEAKESVEERQPGSNDHQPVTIADFCVNFDPNKVSISPENEASIEKINQVQKRHQSSQPKNSDQLPDFVIPREEAQLQELLFTLHKNPNKITKEQLNTVRIYQEHLRTKRANGEVIEMPKTTVMRINVPTNKVQDPEDEKDERRRSKDFMPSQPSRTSNDKANIVLGKGQFGETIKGRLVDKKLETKPPKVKEENQPMQSRLQEANEMVKPRTEPFPRNRPASSMDLQTIINAIEKLAPADQQRTDSYYNQLMEDYLFMVYRPHHSLAAKIKLSKTKKSEAKQNQSQESKQVKPVPENNFNWNTSMLEEWSTSNSSFEHEIAFMQFCEYKTDLAWRTLPFESFDSEYSPCHLMEKEEIKAITTSSKGYEEENGQIQKDWAELRSWIGLLYRYGKLANNQLQPDICDKLMQKSDKLVELDAAQFFARICRIAQDHMIALKAAFLRRLSIYREKIMKDDSISNKEQQASQEIDDCKAITDGEKTQTLIPIEEQRASIVDKIQDEKLKTDIMSQLFLKEIIREINQIEDSANTIEFICPTLISKFLNNFGQDLSWKIYNFDLFNTIVLGEEGINAVYKHGLNLVSKRRTENQGLHHDYITQSDAVKANRRAIEVKIAVDRWKPVKKPIIMAALKQEKNPVEVAVARTRALSFSGNVMDDDNPFPKDTDPTTSDEEELTLGLPKAGTNMNDWMIAQKAAIHRRLDEKERSLGMMPSSLTVRNQFKTAGTNPKDKIKMLDGVDISGSLNNMDTLPKSLYEKDDNKKWFMKNTFPSSSTESDSSDNETQAAQTKTTNSRIEKESPEKALSRKINEMKPVKTASNCKTPNPFDRGIMTTEIYKDKQGIQKILEGIVSWSEDPMLAEVTKIMAGTKELSSLNIDSLSSLSASLSSIGLNSGQIGSNSNNPYRNKTKQTQKGTSATSSVISMKSNEYPKVSYKTDVGNFSLTSYPSVTDDWDWDTPICQSIPKTPPNLEKMVGSSFNDIKEI